MTEHSDLFDRSHSRVKQLLDGFHEHANNYLGSSYSEAQARIDFIDQFFEALGWDVNHAFQRNPYEQEVLVERGVDTSHGQKRADYAFFLAPNFRDIRFFVEAKKPSLNLHRDTDALFQTIRYGWSAGTTLSVVTNFAEFVVLDCRSKPDPGTAHLRILHKFTYRELHDAESFSKIYWLFSKEAHASGSYERFCNSLPKPRGAAKQLKLFRTADQPVDVAFLSDLEGYRERFATMFKKADLSLDGEALTEITQRTLDRLIFLRFLEDKLIETKVSISQFGTSGSTWGDFVAASRRLNGIYNGIVFKPHSILDDPALAVDEAVFADVCDELSDKNSPYLFNAIPIHILGSIYERFLGKIIVTTAKKAHVEDKPEVRKAGGVYYTPEYIVRYIVEETVGRKIENKNPTQIKQMHFADIACGSGSFLLGVYDYLLRYITKWYNANPTVAKKDGANRLTNGTWALSLHQRRELLVACIFGVDVDRQAVEVTQLSLFLKLLEQETTASTHSHQLEFDETLLPSLANNILCGNSLVESKRHFGQLLEDERVINAFDFKQAFEDIFSKDPGFDAIVGNPPYIRIQTLNETHPATAEYVKHSYKTAVGSFDLYSVFIERALTLLNPEGELGYIVPNKFFKTDYGKTLRSFLTTKPVIRKIVDFGFKQVFEATTYTCLLFVSSKRQKQLEYSESDASAAALENLNFRAIATRELADTPWAFSDNEATTSFEQVRQGATKLLELPAVMNRGSSSGADKVFLIAKEGHGIEPDVTRIPIFAGDFGRYRFVPNEEYRIIFPYEELDGKLELIAESALKRKYPVAYEYLRKNKKKLENRKGSKSWYAFSAARSLDKIDAAQIAVPLLANKGMAALIKDNGELKYCPMASGGFTIAVGRECRYHKNYVLGLLNSKIMFSYLRHLSTHFSGGWITCTKQYFGELPIKDINLGQKAKRLEYERIIELVDTITEANIEVKEARTDAKVEFWSRKISATDSQIEEAVGKLYELSDEQFDFFTLRN